MGCDIHFVIEKRVTRWDDERDEAVPTGKWVGVYSTFDTPEMLDRQSKMPPPAKDAGVYSRLPVFKNRNYAFFAKLAGVRGEGPLPKGFPPDASELAMLMGDPGHPDWHSHSWDTLRGFVMTWLAVVHPELCAQAVGERISGQEGGDRLVEYVAGTFDDIDLYRIIYWFDN